MGSEKYCTAPLVYDWCDPVLTNKKVEEPEILTEIENEQDKVT